MKILSALTHFLTIKKIFANIWIIKILILNLYKEEKTQVTLFTLHNIDLN